MEVPTIDIDREEARKRVAEFTARRRRKLTELDHALFRGYKALAEGLTLIDVNKVIKDGGHFEDSFCPKLAIARSDVPTVYFSHQLNWSTHPHEHNGYFMAWPWRGGSELNRNPFYIHTTEIANRLNVGLHRQSREVGLAIDLEGGVIQSPESERHARKRWFKTEYQTIVPPIPFHLRPNGDAEKFFILWEVEKWETIASKTAPGDPLLLERIAHPIYVVVAQWDLTELEKRIVESFHRA